MSARCKEHPMVELAMNPVSPPPTSKPSASPFNPRGTRPTPTVIPQSSTSAGNGAHANPALSLDGDAGAGERGREPAVAPICVVDWGYDAVNDQAAVNMSQSRYPTFYSADYSIPNSLRQFNQQVYEWLREALK